MLTAKDHDNIHRAKRRTVFVYNALHITEPITLFCGNLDPDLTVESLKSFFEANGVEVQNVKKFGFKRYLWHTVPLTGQRTS